jgi:Flp pilus assembly protein TadD
VAIENLTIFHSLQALRVDHFDGTLLSNRSLCWLRLGEGEKALDDAVKCVQLCPKWGKAYNRKGAALMLLQVLLLNSA